MGGQRRRSDLAKERFWRGMLARQRRSGLSIRRFCRREGFSEPSFYWWRRELTRRDAAPASSRDGEIAGGRSRYGGMTSVPSRRGGRTVAATHDRGMRSMAAAGRRRPRPSRFAPVMVMPTLWPTTNSAAYEVQFSGGVRVLVHAAASAKLQDVLAALRPILSSASAGAAES